MYLACCLAWKEWFHFLPFTPYAGHLGYRESHYKQTSQICHHEEMAEVINEGTSFSKPCRKLASCFVPPADCCAWMLPTPESYKNDCTEMGLIHQGPQVSLSLFLSLPFFSFHRLLQNWRRTGFECMFFTLRAKWKWSWPRAFKINGCKSDGGGCQETEKLKDHDLLRRGSRNCSCLCECLREFKVWLEDLLE